MAVVRIESEEQASEIAERRLNRRQVLAGLAMAGIGAVLSACQVDQRAAAQPLSEQAQYAHLLRRAGFGAAPGELAGSQQLGWEGAVDRLMNYQSISNQQLEDRLTDLKLDLTTASGIERWWMVRMVETARPLEEKMTLFWHGLLTSALTKAKPDQMLQQNQFFRANALEDYGTILKGVTRNPAMMRWLDLNTNVVGHANENYSRELMELFTMGPGHYTETDVRESGRAFTGLTLRGQLKSVFVPRRHDDGSKTFLGHTGNYGPDDIIDIILEQPATAPFLARKLVTFFVNDNPEQSTVDSIAGVLTKSNYSIKQGVQAIFLLPEFRTNYAYRQCIKSPAEYAAGMVRQLGIQTDSPYIPASLRLMGQTLFDPPNVAGWPGGAAWLSSGTWLARLNLANYLTTSRKRITLTPSLIFGQSQPASLSDFVDRLSSSLLDGNLGDEQRQALINFGGPAGGYQPGESKWWDEHGRAIVYLTLGLPEYHLN